MITSIRLVNFKNFADETLRVGPFTVIVGANASGKSNIRDAFRFLHGIGRGYTLAEILGRKYGGGGQVEWRSIRGAANEIIRFGQSLFSLEVGVNLNGIELHYSIEVSSLPDKDNPQKIDKFWVSREQLISGATSVFHSYGSGERPEIEESLEPYIDIHPDKPFLTQLLLYRQKVELLSPDDQAVAEQLHSIFANMRFLELSSAQMREPSFPGANILGDSGENLPTVLEEICADPERKKILADWLSELTPMDVADFEFPRDPRGRVYLMLGEANGRKVSADSASDGTLRFLAMLAALLSENSKGLYFFEEIDTGIHPARQWLLLELIEKQAAKNNIQIMTTTHAPDLLTFANDSTFENMSVVCRLEDSHDSIIRPVAELPDAKKLRKSGRGLGGLLTEGWMETALTFTEDYDEAEGDGK